MLRLHVREFVEANAPGLTRYELGRRANLSTKFMNTIWNQPEHTHMFLDNLYAVAQVLSGHLGRQVSICELLEEDTT